MNSKIILFLAVSVVCYLKSIGQHQPIKYDSLKQKDQCLTGKYKLIEHHIKRGKKYKETSIPDNFTKELWISSSGACYSTLNKNDTAEMAFQYKRENDQLNVFKQGHSSYYSIHTCNDSILQLIARKAWIDKGKKVMTTKSGLPFTVPEKIIYKRKNLLIYRRIN